MTTLQIGRNGGESVALLNGTQYSVVRGKFPRTSGSGLYATFSGTFTEAGEPFTMLVTLKNDGTCTATDSEETVSGTFTNNNGLLAMTTEDGTIDWFYDGSYIYMVDELLTEVTVSSDSADSGTARELSFTDLEGKIFNYKKANGDDRWLKFKGGKVYKSSDKTYWNDDTSDNSVALLNGTQYALLLGIFPRTSGSGLYATFSGTFTEDGQPLTMLVTFKNNGTCTMTVQEETSSVTFTNNNGLLATPIEGKTAYWFYDGTSIYMINELLTEVTN